MRALSISLCLQLSLVAGASGEWTFDVAKKERVEALFREWDRHDSPGAVLGIVRRGELVHARGYGSANLDHDVPLRADSAFYIASTSKQFTASGIAVLALENVLDLDDDVRRWVPELREYETPVTIRHLVHHTSGLRDYLSLMAMQGRSFEDYFENSEAIALLARQKGVNFAPGEHYLYSNSNYVLLAEILERATGMSSQEFSEENFFAPLNMEHTRWGLEPNRVMRGRVTSYELQEGDERLRRFVHNFTGHGDGNLWTTVQDLARWDGMFYEPSVLGEELVELILTRGKLRDGSSLDYAFGLVHNTHKTFPTVSHGGAFLGFRTQLLRFPQQGLSVIVLANLASINPGKLAEQVADIVLELPEDSDPDEPPTRVHIPEEVLASFTGEYYRAERGQVLEVVLEDDKLVLKGMRPEPVPLFQRTMRQFGNRSRRLEATFGGEEGQLTPVMVLELPTSAAPVRLHRVERTASDLAELAGRYRSEELDTVWTIKEASGKMLIQTAPPLREAAPAFEPLDRDRLHGEFFDLAFEREGSGRVAAFRVFSARASGMLFERVSP